MAYSETVTKSYGSRLWNSLKWVLFWFLLILWSIYLLWWNEGRTIDVTQGLKQGQEMTVQGSVDPIDSALEWKLVHITWRADTDQMLEDEVFWVKKVAIALERNVEMYQWSENKHTDRKDNLWWSETVTTTYTYDKTWSARKINSDNFKEEWHTNPVEWPFYWVKYTADEVKVWEMQLSNSFISQINRKEEINIDNKILEFFKHKQNISNVTLEWNILYIWKGNINAPEIWDLKIQFFSVNPAEISAIWAQQWDRLVTFTTKTDTKIDLLQYGNIPMEEMFTKAQSDNSFLAWVLRGVGLLLMFIGFNMILGIFVTLAKVIPFLSSILSFWAGIIAFLLTLVLWWGTIIIAWLFVRPFISLSLLAIIWTIIYIIIQKKKSKWNIHWTSSEV